MHIMGNVLGKLGNAPVLAISFLIEYFDRRLDTYVLGENLPNLKYDKESREKVVVVFLVTSWWYKR